MEKQIFRRGILLALAFALVSTTLSARLVHLQIGRYTPPSRSAGVEKCVSVELPAPRGQILDRHGKRLTSNFLVYRLVVDRNLLTSEAVAQRGLMAIRGSNRQKLLREFDPTSGAMGREYLREIATRLAPALQRDPAEFIQEMLETKQVECVLATEMPAETAYPLMEELKKIRAVGIRWEPRWMRQYPQGTHAGHILGYVYHPEPELKLVAAEGAERALDPILAGQPGQREIRLDSLGEAVEGGASEVQPVGGDSVRLTLDSDLQRIAEEQLAVGIAKNRAERGAVVILEPETGAVLAMASYPEFDPNTFQGERTNNAIAMRYEPGSTIKIVAIAGALDRGLVSLNTPINTSVVSDGEVHIPDEYGYGTMPVRKVVSRSINTGTYRIARQLGVERWMNYAAAFGFGQPTGLSLTGEAAGSCRNSGNAVDFSRQTYGYALNVTPLQIASAFSTVAAQGLRHPPRLVDAVLRPDGSEQRIPSAEPTRVISANAARSLTQALVEVTEKGGTATLAAIPGYDVAGKTGTAQRYREQVRDEHGKITQRGGYIDGQYVVSFVGFAPAEKPAFVCAVILDNPRPRDVRPYGGMVAAPIFKEIASRVLEQLEIEPTKPDEVEEALANRE